MRTKSIIALHKTKGELTLEDLKTTPNIPSTIWDFLVEQGIIKMKSEFKQPEEQSTKELIHIQNSNSQQQLESVQNQLREKDSVERAE